MTKRILAILVVSVALSSAAAAAPAAAGYESVTASAPAPVVDPAVQYYRLPHSGQIWELSPWGERPLNWQDWSALGFPGWITLKSTYVKYPWSPNIHAITVLPAHQGRDAILPSRTVQDRLTFEAWSAVGQPRPVVVPWIEGSSVHAWDRSPELFVREPFGKYHKLTFAEWSNAGFPEPFRQSNKGFFRLSWDRSGNIAFMCDSAAGRGTVLTAAEWKAAGSPTPTAVTRTPNDSIWTDPTSPDIYYSSAISIVRLSLAQWQGLGSPMPTQYSSTDHLRECPTGAPIPGRNDVD